MPQLLGFVLLALLPGLAWLIYFYRQDRFDPEPPWLVALTFIAGALAVAPAIALETPLELFLKQLLPPHSDFFDSLNFLLNVALVEEGLKFGIVYGFIYHQIEFDEPIDGIVYASAVALGFASAENLLYMWQMGWDIILLRGLLTNLAHVLFACMWGKALGQARLQPQAAWYLIPLGLLLAMMTHAIYNYLLLLNIRGGILVLVVLMAWMWRSTQRWIVWSAQQSGAGSLPLGRLPDA